MNTSTQTKLAVYFALCCTLGIAAATITNYLPSTDGDWSNPINWIGDVAPADGDSVVLHIMPGATAPTNIDIANLTLATLAFSNDPAASTCIVGQPFSVSNIVCLNSAVPVVTNRIAQDIRFTGPTSWSLDKNNVLILEGALSADDPNYRLTGTTGANSDLRNSLVVLKNTNTFAGGIGANILGINFFHPRAVLPYVPEEPTNAFFSIGSIGMMFSTPPGKYYKYVINLNCGFFTANGAALRPMDSTKIVFNGNISDSDAAKGTGRAGDGYMFVLAPSNALKGNFASSPVFKNSGGITRAMGDYSFGLAVPNSHIRVGDGNSYDLNGFTVFKNIRYYDGNQSIRNYNVDNCSTCAVDVLLDAGGTFKNVFSGPGDVVWAGNIITGNPSLSRGAFMKGGCGTLVYQGASAFTNWVSVRGGTLVLDYRQNNGNKLANALGMTNSLAVRGAVEFIGNDAHDTTERVTDIDTAELTVPAGIRGSYGPASIAIRTGVGRNFTLKARRITQSANAWGASPFDITLVNNGGGVAQVTVSAQDDGVLGGHQTFNRSTWLKIAGGVVAGLADDEYSTTFPGDDSGTNQNVDVTADTAISSNAYVQTMRFNSPTATTLNIDSNQCLTIPSGGILVTPSAGAVGIHGGGTVVLGDDAMLAIHHYGGQPLTMGTQVGSNMVSASVCKAGPGELILTNDMNQFFRLLLFGGTVTLNTLRDEGILQPGGSSSDIIIGNGTLRYIGAGDVCNRSIALRGNAAIDASGSGPLELTARGGAKRVYQFNVNDGDDFPLTLTGTGTGSLAGVIQMDWGCLHKKGSGTWYLGGILSNLETFVHEGTLVVNGRMVSDVYVKPGAVLKGNGDVARDLTVSGTIKPGQSVGTFDAGYLTMMPGSIYEWELDTSNGTADVIRVGSTLELPDDAPNSVTVKVVQVGSSSEAILPAFTFEMFAGDINALFVDTSGTDYGQPSITLDTSSINIGVVPEPCAAVMLALVAVCGRRWVRQA